MINTTYNSLKKLGLFYLPILAIILLASCEKPENTIGLQLQEGDEILGVFVSDSTTLVATTVVEDSLKTDELTSTLLGNYNDPVFGKTFASMYTQIKLSSSNVDFPTAFEVDSVVLSLVYNGNSYGRTTPQAFQVFEITEDLYTDSSYYSNQNTAIDESWDLVQSDGALQDINLLDFAIVDGDSLQPQLRIPLDIDFGNELMTADPSVLVDNTVFQEYFKGICVRSLSFDGAVINFDLVDSESKVTLYYRNFDGDTPDTLSYAFNINSDCARYSKIEHDYSGTQLNGIENNELDGSLSSFVQSGGGVKTHIEFPFLTDYQSFGNITINKAELILPVKDIERFTPQSTLFLLYKDEEGENRLLPDQSSSAHSIGGNFDSGNQYYRFNITRYIQQVISGEIDNTGIYAVSNSAGVTVNRVVLAGPLSPDGNGMKLELTFSE